MPGPAEGDWEQSFEALLDSDPLPADQPPADPSAPAAIFFTSGSTGPAKGVTHTRETLRWMIASAVAAFELDARDVFLPGSSMSHIGSFLWTLSMLSAGGRVVVARSTDSHELLPLLREHQPTVLAMIPAALSALVRDHDLQPGDFASLRICRAGADKVSTELLTEFAATAGFPIVEGYGMTEVGLATLNPPSGTIKQGSIGQPICGFSIAVRGEDGEPVGRGSVGRIWIRTRSRMAGYWDAPEATEEVVRDGWLDSGDLARPDEDGYLWFFGRKKQVIVHDGSNVSPLEVEGALGEHPAVELAGVVGVHDTVHGENVRAYVTLREGSRAALQRRPDRLLPRAHRLQGPRGDRLPRRDAAQPDRQDRPRRAEADGGGPPPPARPRLRDSGQACSVGLAPHGRDLVPSVRGLEAAPWLEPEPFVTRVVGRVARLQISRHAVCVDLSQVRLEQAHACTVPTMLGVGAEETQVVEALIVGSGGFEPFHHLQHRLCMGTELGDQERLDLRLGLWSQLRLARRRPDRCRSASAVDPDPSVGKRALDEKPEPRLELRCPLGRVREGPGPERICVEGARQHGDDRLGVCRRRGSGVGVVFLHPRNVPTPGFILVRSDG